MTTVINLKDLASTPKFVIVDEVDGAEVRHEMTPASVRTFIENVKMIEELGVDASASKEIEMMVTIIDRAFPTLSRERIEDWPIEYIEKISDIARGQNGEIVTSDEQAAKEAKESGNG